jgi:hypothetical protein
MMKKRVMVKDALEVAEGALCSSDVGLMGIIHVKAHILNYVGDVRPGDGEVLKSPD